MTYPKFLLSLLVLFIASLFLVREARAWQNPTQNPPNGNLPPPLDTSATTQTKLGGLSILGNVGIGGTAAIIGAISASGRVSTVGRVNIGVGGGPGGDQSNPSAFLQILTSGGGVDIFRGLNNAGSLMVEMFDGAQGAAPNGTTPVMSVWGGGGRSINAGGSINASGADYAEYFYQDVPGTLHAGDLACLSLFSGKAKQCKKGESLVGIVSSHPGFVGNDLFDVKHPDTTVLIGLVGQLRAIVSGANGSIHIGDVITTSDIPGIGMRADAPGMIVGKALEPFIATSPTATGTINVLIQVGYWDTR